VDDLPNEAPNEHYEEFIGAMELEVTNQEGSQVVPVPRAPYAQPPQ
jgi:hypothetical protein